MLGYCTLHSLGCTNSTLTYNAGVSLAATASDRRATTITFVINIGSSTLAATILASTQTKTATQLAAAVNAAAGNPNYINATQMTISQPTVSGSLASQSDSSSGWVLIVIIVCSAVGGLCLIGILVYVLCTCCKSKADADKEKGKDIEAGKKDIEPVYKTTPPDPKLPPKEHRKKETRKERREQRRERKRSDRDAEGFPEEHDRACVPCSPASDRVCC